MVYYSKGSVQQIKLNKRQVNYIKSIKVGFEFSREYYEKNYDEEISERTARNDISELVKGGWLTTIGEENQTIYKKIDKKLPEDAG